MQSKWVHIQPNERRSLWFWMEDHTLRLPMVRKSWGGGGGGALIKDIGRKVWRQGVVGIKVVGSMEGGGRHWWQNQRERGGLTVHLLSTPKMREHRCYAVNHHQLDTAIWSMHLWIELILWVPIHNICKSDKCWSRQIIFNINSVGDAQHIQQTNYDQFHLANSDRPTMNVQSQRAPMGK